jgi:hypothetical protein
MPTAVLDGNRTCQPLFLTLAIRLVSSEKNIGFTVLPKDNQFRRKINQTHPMLIVGQRTNVKHVSAENASSHENIIKISKTGKLFTAWGEDYFITNSNYPWKDCDVKPAP